MFKLIVFLLISFLSSAIAQSSFQTHKATIEDISNNDIYIQNSDAFTVGSSGIITHLFDETHKTIIAIAEVVSKDGNSAKLRYTTFDTLHQNALPTYKITPKKGDEVVLNFLYNRAIAITPNDQYLKYIQNQNRDIEWIHPDIFASKLYIDYSPRPTKDDFRDQCKKSDLGLIFFGIEQKGYFVDCHSFKVVKDINMPKIANQEEPKVPFYSRFKEISGRVFGLVGGDSITDYNKYYKKLLGIK
jgi:hypothetical protein